ncbi:hypothetical protein KY309_02760 [Candidatus Woesearchaeota archaeon]|nr:hypothetical protein [Candidatus Woesearchaeota archaeon]
MKKSVLLLFLAVVVACAPVQKEAAEPVDFRYGTEGLYMSFVPNLPPPRLLDSEPFNVMLMVENRGTTNVGRGDGDIFLSGFDPRIITMSADRQPVPDLEGRGPFIPKGGFNTVSFSGTIAKLSSYRIDKYQPTILATACYRYETVASAQVCIDPNPFAPASAPKVCTPGTVSLGSQGAPIAVTSVEVEPSPTKTRFRIHLQNVGGGDVFLPDSEYLSKCSPYSDPGLGFNEVDFVRVDEVMIAGTSLKASCKPLDSRGSLRLTGGSASLFCEFDVASMRAQSAYLSPLNVILKYGYRQSIYMPVEIRPTS